MFSEDVWLASAFRIRQIRLDFVTDVNNEICSRYGGSGVGLWVVWLPWVTEGKERKNWWQNGTLNESNSLSAIGKF